MTTAEAPQAQQTPSYFASPAALAMRLSRGVDEEGNEGAPTWIPAAHHLLLNRYLLELAARRITRLVVAMPPRHGKSELCSHWLPVWWLNHWPRQNVILASYQADFAASWGRRVRDTIESHQPLLTAECAINQESSAAARWNTIAGGGMVSAGADGPITGRGAHLFIIDDPYKSRDDADRPSYRERVRRFWSAVARTRLAPNAVVVLIQTRWHEDDLAGTMIARGGWEVLRLPAIADHLDPTGQPITEGEKDPLGREKGEALWPVNFGQSWFNTDVLGEIRDEVGAYVWSALYQGLPTPEEGGGLWTRQMWDEAVRRYVDWRSPTEFDEIIVGIDPSGGSAETGIHVGGVQARYAGDGKTPARPRRGVILEDATTDKSKWAPHAVDAFHRWNADKIVAEANFGGEMVEDVIHAIDPSITVELVYASRGKRVRAEPAAQLFKQQLVAVAQPMKKSEDETVRWEPDMGMASPNRLDSLVWTVHAMELTTKPGDPHSVSGREGMTEKERRTGDLVLRGKQYVDRPDRRDRL